MRKKVVCYESGGHLRRWNGKLVGGRDDDCLMMRGGLWLTSGGRVVKPGCGEYAAVPADLPLLGRCEIESGVDMAEFDRRWRAAVKAWKAARKVVAMVFLTLVLTCGCNTPDWVPDDGPATNAWDGLIWSYGVTGWTTNGAAR